MALFVGSNTFKSKKIIIIAHDCVTLIYSCYYDE